MSAFGVSPDDADTLAAERLSRLVDNVALPMQCVLLSFDSRYDKDGTLRIDKTPIYVPNDYVHSMQVVSCCELFAPQSHGTHRHPGDHTGGITATAGTSAPHLLSFLTVFPEQQAHPSVFVAACSVHPYRADACHELERCAARGARICKVRRHEEWRVY